MLSVQQRPRYYEITFAAPPSPDLRVAVYGPGSTDVPVCVSPD
jgi:hypothetical protein